MVSQQGIPATQFTDSQGRVPTIYRLDMSDPGAFLVAQGFIVKNKDVIYVANASSTEFGKFLNIMVQVLYPIVNGKLLID
jgi:polysaccharide export outer membrane protein